MDRNRYGPKWSWAEMVMGRNDPEPDGVTNVYINKTGHMTKMAAMPIYGKIFFSETNGLISMKLGVKHRWLKYYNVYI